MTNLCLFYAPRFPNNMTFIGKSPGFAKLSCFNSTSQGAGKQAARCSFSWTITPYTLRPSTHQDQPAGRVRKAVTMSATHLTHKYNVWGRNAELLNFQAPLCFEGLNKYWDFHNSEHWTQSHSPICLRRGDEINFVCGRNWIVNCQLSGRQTANPCALIYDPKGSSSSSNSPFHLPQQKAFTNTGRCQSSERGSASAIELLSGKQQPLARLSFVTRLVRVTSIMASLALTAHA
jgi:hypothetical protein